MTDKIGGSIALGHQISSSVFKQHQSLKILRVDKKKVLFTIAVYLEILSKGQKTTETQTDPKFLRKSIDAAKASLEASTGKKLIGVDDQFKGLIPPEIQLQDLEGGMEEGDIATEAEVDNL